MECRASSGGVYGFGGLGLLGLAERPPLWALETLPPRRWRLAFLEIHGLGFRAEVPGTAGYNCAPKTPNPKKP